jgi:hypothetical protein
VMGVDNFEGRGCSVILLMCSRKRLVRDWLMDSLFMVGVASSVLCF